MSLLDLNNHPGPPLQPWVGRIFVVLDPSNGSRLWAPEDPENLGSGASNSPHRPQNVGPQHHQRLKWAQKCTEAKMTQNHHRKVNEPKSRGGANWVQNQFFRGILRYNGDKTPLLEDF
ncbi:hypothetical protein O181_056825 [Austropuccinia psidii MF-1]|uniref:Uncharacterized protein n=1 Tax=Austropuccinia psidii MF-1 TaxID=1389203 RepID=A0A9Q3E6T9_9BASI|nr:hypothetical protein [Austropuccinia psidii MF-1]